MRKVNMDISVLEAFGIIAIFCLFALANVSLYSNSKLYS